MRKKNQLQIGGKNQNSRQFLTLVKLHKETRKIVKLQQSMKISHFSSSIRFVDDPQQLSTRLKPPIQRLRRKRKTVSNREARTDLFLSGETKKGGSVLAAIDAFDKNATVPEKTSANFAILRGYHVSTCSDSYGAISQALVRKPDIERKSANLQVRSVNQKYHEVYNSHSNSIPSNVFLLLIPLLLKSV